MFVYNSFDLNDLEKRVEAPAPPLPLSAGVP